jgi:mRNA-degrading endonuclease toxin of MazEF toxin-antitoxin module
VRRGEIWRYEPVIARSGQSTARLIVSADSINLNEALPVVYVMHVVDSDPQSLLAVRVGERGWALATEIDRPVRKRLTEKIGKATAAEMERVDTALSAVFDL